MRAVTDRRLSVGFSSPWRTITFDRVDDVSESVTLAGAEGNYEISVPLSSLGLKPQPGRPIALVSNVMLEYRPGPPPRAPLKKK